MTKAVRIENADTTNHKIRVFSQVWDETKQEWVSDGGTPVKLDYPTELVTTYVWATKRLIIEEYN